MKKPKEGRDFTIYAKNIEMENQIENNIIDTSFAFFVSDIIDKDKFRFSNEYSELIDKYNEEIDEMIFCMFASIKKDPTSFKEALSSENKNKWEMATRQKLDSMNDNN